MEYIQITVHPVLLKDQEENMLITISREFGSGGREIDKRRVACRADFTQKKWGGKADYHLCINTADIETKRIMPVLADYIRACAGNDWR